MYRCRVKAPSIRGVHHLAVLVDDLRRAEDFYVGVLGLDVIQRHDDARGGHRSTWVALDATRFLAIERFEGQPREPAGERLGHHCLALDIVKEDREAWIAHLTERGIPIERETAFTIYVRDPDGALVAFSHYPH